MYKKDNVMPRHRAQHITKIQGARGRNINLMQPLTPFTNQFDCNKCLALQDICPLHIKVRIDYGKKYGSA